MFCLAQQEKLQEIIRREGKAPRFPKRKGINSSQKSYEIYKREYMDLDSRLKTKAKKEQVTQYLIYSVVWAPLADVPLDVISPATIHVISGLTKNVQLVVEIIQ